MAIPRGPAPVSDPWRWRFGPAVFDESKWTLTIDGRRVGIEGKPLELLRELLRREGTVASKSELMDALWPDVAVVEASLTTAVLKLRRALGDDDRGERIVETIPRLGYRLSTAVIREPAVGPRTNDNPRRSGRMSRSWRIAALAGAVALGAGGYAVTTAFRTPARPAFTQRDAQEALNAIDLARLRTLIDAGWNPNTSFGEDNGALNTLLAVCEWHPGHDRQRMLLAARMLLDAGARLDRRNVWGDTPYSIAKAKRYCGPDHPVTQMLHAICYSGPGDRLRDKCLASYELRRRSSGRIAGPE